MSSQNNTISKFIKEKECDITWIKKLSFTNVLVCSNMMQTMFSKTQEGITSKQWLLLAIASSVDEPLTLSEIGEAMGCSRQNVKQIAQILNKKDYLRFTKLDGDKNTVRIVPTQKWFDYCSKNDRVTSNILEEIFDGFSEQELRAYFQSFKKIINNIEKINNDLKEK